MGIALRWGSATDVGRVRTNNEDSFLEADTLFAVADGMGGHAGGEVASSVAVQALKDHVEPGLEGLVKGVRYANRAVWARADDDPDLRGMGTTMTALALVPNDDGERLVIAHVGDSRAYRFSEGELTQVTEDHSLVEDLVREGRLSHEEARNHPQRNIVTRALGNQPDVEVDTFEVEPYRGDRYVLASDGLFDEVDEDRIAAVLRRLDDPHDVAAELVRLANEGGGRDNITVVVVDVVDDGGKAEAASVALAAEPGTAVHRPVAPEEPAALVAEEPPPPVAAASAAPESAPKAPRRLTVRSVLFVLLLLAILGGAAGAIWWSATSTYYVGFDGEEVAIFRGRPGGVLFLDPTLEERTDLTRDDVPENRLDDLDDGHQVASLAAARRYVENLEDEAEPPTTTTSSTSSTSSTVVTTTTTTAAPAAPTSQP